MAQITGYNKNDILNGTDADDSFWGGGGDDVMKGMGGNDFFGGGPGADIMKGGAGTDTVDYWNFSTEGVWVDLASGTGARGYAAGDQYIGIENVGGTKLNDVITGDEGDNIVWGYDGDDVIKGAGGADDLRGGDGNDTIKGGAGADILEAGRGVDTLIGGVGDDIYYMQGDDTVIENAGEGYDWVYALDHMTLPDNVEGLVMATRGAANAYGNALSNTIFGNDKDNIIDGGGGNDSLVGGGGNDTFVFQAGQTHGDVIYDFEGNGAGAGDTLKFVGFGAGATLQQYSATEWYVASANGSILEVITLVGAPTLDPSDYVFV